MLGLNENPHWVADCVSAPPLHNADVLLCPALITHTQNSSLSLPQSLRFAGRFPLMFRVSSACCDFEEEGRRHRIAFNSLYLFSFRSIIYEANGEELYNFTRGVTLNWISTQYAVCRVSAAPLIVRSIVSWRRGLHDA